jgi:hypothetical protein
MQAADEALERNGGGDRPTGANQRANPGRVRAFIERRNVTPALRPLCGGFSIVALEGGFAERMERGRRGPEQDAPLRVEPGGPPLPADVLETLEEIAPPKPRCIFIPLFTDRDFERARVERARLRINKHGIRVSEHGIAENRAEFSQCLPERLFRLRLAPVGPHEDGELGSRHGFGRTPHETCQQRQNFPAPRKQGP